MTSDKEPRLEFKTILTVIGLLITAVVGIYGARLALAEDLSVIKTDAAVLETKVAQNAATVAEIRGDIRDINVKIDKLDAKVDVMLRIWGVDEKNITSASVKTQTQQ